MSFILDALKKSESDRQRQSGPALFEVRVAPPRNSLPVWAIGLAVLLAVNLVIVAWVLLRRPAAAEQTAPTMAAAPSNNPGANPATANTNIGAMANANLANAPVQPSALPQQGLPGGNMGQGGYPGQVGYPSPGPQQSFAQQPPPTVPVAGTPPSAPLGQTAGMTQPAPGAGQSNAMTAANDAATGAGENPDDYAPAADPSPAPFGNHVTRSTSSGVPLYQDAQQTAHLPNLHLDLHVYAANPQQRFVMINTHKLREGDALPEGVHVESITPDGAVLSLNGTRFLLPRE